MFMMLSNVSAPLTPHLKRLPDPRCGAPDFFLELADHDATRRQSRESVPLPKPVDF